MLAVVLFVGQRLMRPLFHIVAKQKSSELFVLFVLLVTLGLAWVTELAGLSLALGAFLGGHAHLRDRVPLPGRRLHQALPRRAPGLLLRDHRHAPRPRAWWPRSGSFVALVVVSLLALKFVLIFWLGRRFGNDKPTALRCALALAPAGEFGFVLLSLAGREAALDPRTLQVVLAGALLSMLVTPVLLANSERIVLYFVESEWTQRAMALHQLAVKTMATQGHVIVCGYGRSGQALARFLEREGVSVIALDADPERVRQAAAAGDSVVFGDASRREVLAAAALSRAMAVVVSFADTAQGAHDPRARARDAPGAAGDRAHLGRHRRGQAARGGCCRDRGRGGGGLPHARHADHDAARRAAQPRAAQAARGARGALPPDERLLPGRHGHRGRRRGGAAAAALRDGRPQRRLRRA